MGWNVSCGYLKYCVSRILFRMSLAMNVRCASLTLYVAQHTSIARLIPNSIRLTHNTRHAA